MAVGSYAYKLEVVHVLLFWFLSALSAQGRQLLKPENITIKQNEGVVTIKWESFYKCPEDVPDNYHISLRSRGNGSTTDWELSTFGKLYNSDWELNISDTLRPYSVYTVYIFGFIKRDEMKGPIAQKTFRTKEAAPSKPPSIECSICVKTSFFKDYRNVTVRWKLPPRDLRNGIIRSAVLIFWEEGHPDNASTLLIQHNLTFAIVPRLLQTSKYLFKVKICTLPHLCSGYSEVGHILEEYELTKSRTDQKSNSWITGLSIGLPVVVVVVVIVLVFCVLWRRKKRSYQETSDLMIQDYQLSETGFLGNTIEINKSDGALSVAFGEYHYLTPPVSEKSE